MRSTYFERGFFALFFLFLFSCNAVAAAQQKEVRIGFFPMQGFHEYNKSGEPVGYDVDYLHRIASYTQESYRFVRVESWDQALEKLAAGEIDLVGSAQISPERTERFDYSAYSNGTTYAAIITLSGDVRMNYETFERFNGARFGCVKTYIRKDDFMSYAKRKGFAASMVWFDSTEQMRKALHAREIDAMLCSIMEIGKNEKAVAEFAPAPFYYITSKGNAELLDTINAAIARIKIDYPDFESNLMDTWYPVSRIPSFSREEQAYIRAHPTLRVGQFLGRSPLSGTDTNTVEGRFVGIIPELIELIGRESGLEIDSVPIPQGAPPLDLLKTGRADAVAGVVAFAEQIQNPSIRLSEAFFTGQLIMLIRRGEPFISNMPLKAVVPTGYKAAADCIKKAFPSFSIMELDTARACLNAVQMGKADITVQNAYVLDPFLHGPRYDNLMVLPILAAPERLVFALPADVDPRLLSILNKSIRRLPLAVRQQIVINNTVAKPYVITFEDFVYQYRLELLTSGSLLALCGLFLCAYWRQRRKNMELIRENEETLRNITNNINGGVITLIADKGFTITYANNGFLELIGYTREQYEEEQKQECVTYVHQDDVQLLNQAIASKRSGDSVALELRIIHKTGATIPVMFRGSVAKCKEGQVILFCVVMDVSEQRAMIEKLKIEKERYQIIVEQSNDIIFEVDLQAQTLLCSPRFKQKFGWQMSSDSISESAPYPLQVHPDDANTLQDMVQRILCGERSQIRQIRIRKIDGDYLWCRLLVSCIRQGSHMVKLLGKIEDVDEMVRERLRLEEMSRTDALCGLYNKRALQLSVERGLKLGETEGQESALFFIDLDNFKAVNDNLGHPVGDQALRDVASALRKIFRSEDVIGRFGGDEFCVFATHIPESTVLTKAAEINTRLRRSYGEKGGLCVGISASVGVACAPYDGNSYDELVSKADRALYTAKQEGKDRYVLYDAMACACSAPKQN